MVRFYKNEKKIKKCEHFSMLAGPLNQTGVEGGVCVDGCVGVGGCGKVWVCASDSLSFSL